ncbi:hypothetical protein WJX73_002069 [Symbiochloris irregularis]|uniref:AP2/ERF domain-containing protein n=1 Tax=Symbiochloris irregularis TaxID=706552 RepID=A0AAW1P9W2_9CHLO
MGPTRAASRAAVEQFDLNQAASVLLGLNSPGRPLASTETLAPLEQASPRVEPQNKTVKAAARRRATNSKPDVPTSSKTAAGKVTRRSRRSSARQFKAYKHDWADAAAVPPVNSDKPTSEQRDLPSGKLRGVQRKRDGWTAQIYVPPGPVQIRIGSSYTSAEAAARAHDRAQIAVRGRSCTQLNFPISSYALEADMLRGPNLNGHFQSLHDDIHQDGPSFDPAAKTAEKKQRVLQVPQLVCKPRKDATMTKAKAALFAQHEASLKEQLQLAGRTRSLGCAGLVTEGGDFVPLLHSLPSRHLAPHYNYHADLQAADRAREEGRRSRLTNRAAHVDASLLADEMSLAVAHAEAPAAPLLKQQSSPQSSPNSDTEETWTSTVSPGFLQAAAAMQGLGTAIARDWCLYKASKQHIERTHRLGNCVA